MPNTERRRSTNAQSHAARAVRRNIRPFQRCTDMPRYDRHSRAAVPCSFHRSTFTPSNEHDSGRRVKEAVSGRTPEWHRHGSVESGGLLPLFPGVRLKTHMDIGCEYVGTLIPK